MIKNCNYDNETGVPHQTTEMTCCDCGSTYVCPTCGHVDTLVQCICKDMAVFRPFEPKEESELILGIDVARGPDYTSISSYDPITGEYKIIENKEDEDV